MKKKILITSLTTLLVILATISTCAGIGYITQAVNGHFRLMRSRVPIDRILNDPAQDTLLKQKLHMVRQIHEFAVRELGLPDNKSYTLYAEIKTEELGWNIYCAPEFSTNPRKWRFPIAGSTVYRGYFSQKMAIRYARKMERKGYDVYITPIVAYSTLGFFNDPILNTHLRMDTVRLAGMIIHEMAHQRYYNKKDSRFSESFAVAVERAGVLRWLQSINRPDQMSKAQKMWARQDSINNLYLAARDTLSKLYATVGPPLTSQDTATLRRQKDSVFNRLSLRIKELNQTLGISATQGTQSPTNISVKKAFETKKPETITSTNNYDIKARGTNITTSIPEEFRKMSNARLIPVSTYYSLVPTFLRQLDSLNGDFSKFYYLWH
ncbi:Aminopeptidase [Bacteroidales bacterium CF]|jgi:Predicted aminopeptidase|nr:Aminopeptidase [Bacteroidales bacterium CF]